MTGDATWLSASNDKIDAAFRQAGADRVQVMYETCNSILQKEHDRRSTIETKATTWLGISIGVPPLWLGLVGAFAALSDCPPWLLALVTAPALVGTVLSVLSALGSRACLRPRIVNQADPNYLWETPEASSRELQINLARSAYRAAMQMQCANNELVDTLRRAQENALGGILLFLVSAVATLLCLVVM